jgi:PPOX class probable FMN-dependent enzyme
MDIIADAKELRETYGAPTERSLKKQMSRFDKHSREFVARSPFLVIASTDRSGRCDASPKGDAQGFVQVNDDTTLLIPDRLGNNRVDALGNPVARPGIGLIFFVPGINETLRVNGQVCVTPDHALLEPLAVNGKVPRSGILVSGRRSIFTAARP